MSLETLKRRLKTTFGFFSPRNSAVRLPPKNTALLVIDLQDYFCLLPQRGTAHLSDLAGNVNNILPQMRAAGVDIYFVRYVDKSLGPRNGYHKVTRLPGDHEIIKKKPSAFQDTSLDEVLKKAGKTNLLVCGVYTTSCIEATVSDGLRNKFNIHVLQDLVADMEQYDTKTFKMYTETLRKNGARFVNAADVLQNLAIKPLAARCGKS